ncbi:MAG: His/Gly/Thr/Pro-type tRNA ligase C-terminal domain-containing protein [Patescibacteria group bacterium]
MIYTKTLSKTNPTDLLKRAMNIASCYGFDSIDKIIAHEKKWNSDMKEKNDAEALLNTKKAPLPNVRQKYVKQTVKTCNTDTAGDEIFCALKTVIDNELLPCDHPILIHQSSVANNSTKEKTFHFGLVAIGMKKSIAEALIIKTATTILEDIGIKDIQVHINSIGDKDSSLKFVNELNLYFRKNINSVPSQIRQSVKKDIFKAYDQLHKGYSSSGENIPQPIKFLSDNNRKHLSEVLEYMETVGIPYEIDNFLIGNNEYYSQTLFEIHNTQETEGISVVAKGGRCDELVKRMFNVDIPTVGIVFEFERKGIKEKELQMLKRAKKPKIYFIQLGREAKRKSLPIIDVLRKSNIHTHHSLDNDKLSEQLSLAQYLEVPYAIIMGHREALDGTVIVRDMDTQFQHTVLVDDLALYLKGMHI